MRLNQLAIASSLILVTGSPLSASPIVSSIENVSIPGDVSRGVRLGQGVRFDFATKETIFNIGGKGLSTTESRTQDMCDSGSIKVELEEGRVLSELAASVRDNFGARLRIGGLKATYKSACEYITRSAHEEESIYFVVRCGGSDVRHLANFAPRFSDADEASLARMNATIAGAADDARRKRAESLAVEEFWETYGTHCVLSVTYGARLFIKASARRSSDSSARTAIAEAKLSYDTLVAAGEIDWTSIQTHSKNATASGLLIQAEVACGSIKAIRSPMRLSDGATSEVIVSGPGVITMPTMEHVAVVLEEIRSGALTVGSAPTECSIGSWHAQIDAKKYPALRAALRSAALDAQGVRVELAAVPDLQSAVVPFTCNGSGWWDPTAKNPPYPRSFPLRSPTVVSFWYQDENGNVTDTTEFIHSVSPSKQEILISRTDKCASCGNCSSGTRGSVRFSWITVRDEPTR